MLAQLFRGYTMLAQLFRGNTMGSAAAIWTYDRLLFHHRASRHTSCSASGRASRYTPCLYYCMGRVAGLFPRELPL